MPEALLETWRARGVEIVQGYGLTEAAPNVLCLPPEDAVRKAGYAGKPYPHVDVSTPARPEDELLVRGPNVFAGYWRNDEATARRSRDGWLRTGDIAERDDEGYYRIRGRLKDMYISGGENVYPAEVESALLRARRRRRGRPRRARRALGRGRRCVRRARSGTRRPATSFVESAARGSRASRCRRRSRFVDELPRSAMNKVLKDELRARVHGVTGPSLAARCRRPHALRPRRATRARRLLEAAERSSPTRLPRGVDREDHRGGRRRAGHLLPLLRDEEGRSSTSSCCDLNRRVRHAMKEASSKGDHAPRGRGARLRARTSASPPSTRRSTGSSARPSSSRPRCCATTTSALTSGYVEALEAAIESGEIGEVDPRSPPGRSWGSAS